VQSWRASLDPNASPQQRRETIGTIANGMMAAVEPMETQRDKAMGAQADKYQIIDPKTRALLQGLIDKGRGMQRATPATGAQPTLRFNPATGQVEVIK
jgi:hypothetical protein